MSKSLLRLPEVKKRTGLSRSQIYLLISREKFPKPISLCGARAVGWVNTSIDEWVDERIRYSGRMS